MKNIAAAASRELAATSTAGPCLRTFVDGNASGPTVVFVHGWPDDHTMWDTQVSHLKDRYRCVTTDLPGFSADDHHAMPEWGYSIDEVVRRLERTVQMAGDGQPVILVGHDWGCTYTFILQKKRPELVRKIVALDVGGAIEPSALSLALIVSYHLWLIVAFALGGLVGDAMARSFAWLVGAPRGARVARAGMGYPYYHWWQRKLSKDQEKITAMMPEVPLLFLYGTAGIKKLLLFHAKWWAEKVQAKEGSSCFAMAEAGHWVTRDQPDEVNRRLDAFLAEDKEKQQEKQQEQQEQEQEQQEQD